MGGMIGLDFETYSQVDLPKHGLERYVRDDTFKVLLGDVTRQGGNSKFIHTPLDFVFDTITPGYLDNLIGDTSIVAHNASFERAVLRRIGLDYPAEKFIDSAVIARAAGAGSRLEAAAPQLLGHDKIEAGKGLMKTFSFPGKYQEANGDGYFDDQVVIDNPVDWANYAAYCGVDSELGLRLAIGYTGHISSSELLFAQVTMEMNDLGWCVDVPLVEEMQRRYLENLAMAEEQFRNDTGAADLNLNSLKQLKEWCSARGIRAHSFAEKKVEQLIAAITKKITNGGLSSNQAQNYGEVLQMLETKQVLGGSSLKKLAVILDTAVPDLGNPGRYRLLDQYIHCGAGQTLRTTGRSTQMQNLKRLDQGNIADMDELLEDTYVEWDNDKLALNIRQSFTATDEEGMLIVGDFKSVESRALAWAAGETWKTDAYRQGLDLYKVQAQKMFGLAYDAVTADQRTTGKVGELSCGYGAGSGAVKDFAAGMGVTFNEAEATKLVYDWRDACPMTLAFWARLDEMLKSVVEHGKIELYYLPDGLVLRMAPASTPASLNRQHFGVLSVSMHLVDPNGDILMKRFFHGCHIRGRNVTYYRPSDLKTGDLWKRTFTDPKTKQLRFHELYGGKLAGIFIQSLCREFFMHSLLKVYRWTLRSNGQVGLVGQFHDEIVLDWKPGYFGGDGAKANLESYMSRVDWAPSFPLAADIKTAYRYIK